MRTRPIVLSKTCPYCGARSKAEAQMPIPANLPIVEFNLDDLGTLLNKQTLSQLLALVELLPYKTFACVKCRAEFRLESQSTKDLIGAMLTSMRPVRPYVRGAKPRTTTAAKPRPPESATQPASRHDWESESLDGLFDYSVAPKP